MSLFRSKNKPDRFTLSRLPARAAPRTPTPAGRLVVRSFSLSRARRPHAETSKKVVLKKSDPMSAFEVCEPSKCRKKYLGFRKTTQTPWTRPRLRDSETPRDRTRIRIDDFTSANSGRCRPRCGRSRGTSRRPQGRRGTDANARKAQEANSVLIFCAATIGWTDDARLVVNFYDAVRTSSRMCLRDGRGRTCSRNSDGRF